MDDNTKEFILAYVALCKKHQICVAPEAWCGAVCLAEYEDGDWVEDIVLSEGVEMFESLQKEV